MAKEARSRHQTRRRTVFYAVGSAAVVLLLIAGLALANSVSVSRVTDNARSLHWTNATMGTSALTRAGLVQAVTFFELEDASAVDAEDLKFAMDQVEGAVAELEHLYDIGASHDSYAALARFRAQVERAVGALTAGEIAETKQIVTTDLESTYIDLSNSLQVEQDFIQAAIEDNSEAGRALNGWVVFVLTLAVPGSAVAVYFVIARRQVKSVRERTRLELEAQRQISSAKDEFIAGLSHELRTPLTSIYGFAEILTDGDVQGAEATQETAQIIANEAAEMTRMVDDLLAASRLDSTGVEIEMAATPLQEVVEAAITPFERAGMTVNRKPTPAVAVTDAARLRHAVINLLSNAARHGGPNVGVEVVPGDNWVDIEVWDDGPGVPKEQEERLFKRFVHAGTEPMLTGSIGLGLAVASRLVNLMDGKLQYQRFSGRTYFTITIPVGEMSSGADDDPTVSVAQKIRALSS